MNNARRLPRINEPYFDRDYHEGRSGGGGDARSKYKTGAKGLKSYDRYSGSGSRNRSISPDVRDSPRDRYYSSKYSSSGGGSSSRLRDKDWDRDRGSDRDRDRGSDRDRDRGSDRDSDRGSDRDRSSRR